jgi:hypothetical protein
MSASRAIASAKNRKAGGNNPNPATPQPVPQQPSSSSSVSSGMSDSSVSKISIPQAIQLLGNRINNLEDFMGNTSMVIQDIQSFNTDTKDKYIVDAEVFSSLVNRIESIESYQKNSENVDSGLSRPVLKRQTNQVYSDDLLTKALTEIDTLKTNFIKLQSYVMQTNAKLSDIVFSNPGESVLEFKELFNKNNSSDTDISKNLVAQEIVSSQSNISDLPILTPPTLQRGDTFDTNGDSSIPINLIPPPSSEIKSMLKDVDAGFPNESIEEEA